MKVTEFDEIEPELLSVGQTTNQSFSLRKEASLEVAGHTKREAKSIAEQNRKEKNAKKGKVERSKTSKREEKVVAKRLRERKNKEELFNSQLETFVLEEPENKQMTENQKAQIHKDLEKRRLLGSKLCPDKESISDDAAKDIDKFAVKQFYRREKREK